MISESNDENCEIIINLIEKFIKKAKIIKPLRGICILTVAQDNSSLCGCFVFNYDSKTLLKHYPARYDTNSPVYRELNNIKYTINFASSLPEVIETGKYTGVPEDELYYPLCCKECKKTTTKQLSNENEFDKFIKKNGTSKYICSITKKIQHGELIYNKYYSLINNKLKEEPLNEDVNKLNSFKLLTCSVHNTYYSIGLHTTETVYNYHHAKGQNETFYGSKILKMIEQAII